MFYVTDFPTTFSEIHEVNEKRDDVRISIEKNGEKYITFLCQFDNGEKFPAFDTKEDAAKFIISCCEMEIASFQKKMEKLKKEIEE